MILGIFNFGILVYHKISTSSSWFF